MTSPAPLEPNYRKWMRRPQWTLFEAVCLVTGQEPPKNYEKNFLVNLLTKGLSSDIYADLKGAASRAWIQSWAAQAYGNHSVRVDPKECVNWVSNQGYKIPNGLFAAASELSETHAIALGAADNAIAKSEGKQRRQEQAILNFLTSNGHDPKKLPKRPPGISGPKAKVKKAMLANKTLFTDKSFELAWERLRSAAEIMGG